DLDPFDRAEVEHLAAPHHRLRQRERLDARHAAEDHGHQPRGHLAVGDVAEQVGAEQPVDLLGWMLAAVALAADYLECIHEFIVPTLPSPHGGEVSSFMPWRCRPASGGLACLPTRPPV